MCQLRATLRTGDALIYNSALLHKGEAHFEDVHKTPRVVIFLTFAGSRQEFMVLFCVVWSASSMRTVHT